MPCYNPVLTPTMDHYFPCGRCEACLKAYALQWAQRMLDEYHANNDVGFMVTLTYDDEHLPPDGELQKKDLQDFWKRLRAAIVPKKIRYFACGEYGGKFGRPHYHAVIFGWIPDDLKLKGYKDYFGSDFLASKWKNGYVHVIVDMTVDTLKYNAKYLNKLKSHWKNVEPFTVMSRKPGIGAAAVTPEMLLTGVRYIDGQQYPVPRFYLKKLYDQGFDTSLLKISRQEYFRKAYGEGPSERTAAKKRYSAAFLAQSVSTIQII